MANLATVLLLCQATTMVSLDPDSCSEEWDAMRILERGTIEEVWTAFEEGEEPDFDGIGEPDYEPLAECRVALVRSLVRAVDRRDDIRIPARILDEIDFDLAPALEPVLQAGLRHRAPEIRRRAARAVTDAEDLDWAGVVEERFAIETDEGVRRDLMTALAMMESRRFVREIGEIAAGADLASMRIAVDALTALPVEEDSVSALERFALMQEDDSQELLAVIDALGESTDIPHARDLLRRIEESGPTDAARRAGKLLDPPDAETMSVTFSCGGGSGVPSRALPLATGNFREFEDLLFYVDPDDGELTARCWDAPGFMWPDDLRPRVDIGTAVRVNDEFVWKGQPWYLVLGPTSGCWMPARDLDLDEVSPIESSGIEVDVVATEARSWLALVLESSGWLFRLGEDDRLATLRIDADADDPGVVSSLRKLADIETDSGIAEAIRAWLYKNEVTELSPP